MQWFRQAMGYLNKPFAIWLLSSVILGLVSFTYTTCSEQRAERLRNEQQATRTFFEAKFRIEQMDEVLRAAQQLADGEEEKKKNSAIRRTFAVVHLGGIVSFPADDEGQVWVDGSGVGIGFLPSGRGYQDESFKGYSLLNLWYSFHSLTCDARPSGQEVEQISSKLQALKGVVPKDSTIDDALGLVTRAEKSWSNVKESLQMFLHPGPRFDLLSYCEMKNLR